MAWALEALDPVSSTGTYKWKPAITGPRIYYGVHQAYIMAWAKALLPLSLSVSYTHLTLPTTPYV